MKGFYFKFNFIKKVEETNVQQKSWRFLILTLTGRFTLTSRFVASPLGQLTAPFHSH